MAKKQTTKRRVPPPEPEVLLQHDGQQIPDDELSALTLRGCLIARDAVFNVRDFLTNGSRMAFLSIKDCEKELDQIERQNEALLEQITVIDFNPNVFRTLGNRGIHVIYGDISNVDTLVHAGIGKAVSHGRVTLLGPTEYVGATGRELTIDGVKFEFQFTPGAEAQTEMNFFLPQLKALCVADNCIHAMHNLYSLRGTEVRDGKAWSEFLNEAVGLANEYAPEHLCLAVSEPWRWAEKVTAALGGASGSAD